jgi:hypothetical protein
MLACDNAGHIGDIVIACAQIQGTAGAGTLPSGRTTATRNQTVKPMARHVVYSPPSKARNSVMRPHELLVVM